jgi:hypothetical protein
LADRSRAKRCLPEPTPQGVELFTRVAEGSTRAGNQLFDGIAVGSDRPVLIGRVWSAELAFWRAELSCLSIERIVCWALVG